MAERAGKEMGKHSKAKHSAIPCWAVWRPVYRDKRPMVFISVLSQGCCASFALAVLCLLHTARACNPPALPIVQLQSPTSTALCWPFTQASYTVTVSGSVFPTEAVSTGSVPHFAQPLTCAVVSPVAGGGRYTYAVRGVGCTSATVASFLQPPAPGVASAVPIRLWVIADVGFGTATQAATVRGKDAFVAASHIPVTATLALGDLAYNQGKVQEFHTKFFGPNAAQFAGAALLPAYGNHDSYSNNGAAYFSAFAALPSHGGFTLGVASNTTSYYSVTLGCVHLQFLDSMTSSRAPTGPMALWAAADATAARSHAGVRWYIVGFHHPPYGVPGQIWSADMRTVFLPILEAHGVDMVLAGHLHKYERSYLLDGYYGRSWSASYVISGAGAHSVYSKPAGIVPRRGAVYVTTGTSGVPAPGLSRPRPDLAAASVSAGSLICDVLSAALTCRQVAADSGEVLDSWTIRKS